MVEDAQINLRINRELYKRFREVAQKNREIPSKVIRDLIREYVCRHNPPDGQLHLDRILAGEPRPGKPPKCKFCDRPATYIQYWVRNRNWTEQVPVCDVHRSRVRHETILSYGERRL